MHDGGGREEEKEEEEEAEHTFGLIPSVQQPENISPGTLACTILCSCNTCT